MRRPETHLASKIQQFGQTGQLYILIAALVWAAYALSRNVGIYDWHKELAYFEYIKSSLFDFQVWPFFWWQKLPELWRYPAVTYTSNFMSNPETMLFSPLIVFLKFMEVITYIKFVAFVHYLIGLGGVLALRRRLQWNNTQFRVYLALFFFSPIIIQHLAVGYTPWLNLFFFPWVIYFLIEQRALLGALCLAAILAVILLQGGTHVFWWFVLLAALFSFSLAAMRREWAPFIRLGLTLISILFLAFVRIYASTQSFAGFQQDFVNGYHFANFSAWALVPTLLLPPVHTFFIRYEWDGVPAWDGGVFWGLALVMTLILLFKYRDFRKYKPADETTVQNQPIYDALLVSSIFLLALSFFSVYEHLVQSIIAVMPVPFLAGIEKYPFRFAIPAFLGLSILLANYSNEIWRVFDHLIISAQRLPILQISLSRLQRGRLAQVPRHIWYELTLVGPLLFVTIMWLMLAVANPFDAYPVQTVAPPTLVPSFMGNLQVPVVVVTPEQLTLSPAPATPKNFRYIFADIRAEDRKFLDVSSTNAVLSESDGKLALLPDDQGPIVVKFRAANYETSIFVTVAAWAILIALGCSYFLYRRIRHA